MIYQHNVKYIRMNMSDIKCAGQSGKRVCNIIIIIIIIIRIICHRPHQHHILFEKTDTRIVKNRLP